jgi:hypothetical protein
LQSLFQSLFSFLQLKGYGITHNTKLAVIENEYAPASLAARAEEIASSLPPQEQEGEGDDDSDSDDELPPSLSDGTNVTDKIVRMPSKRTELTVESVIARNGVSGESLAEFMGKFCCCCCVHSFILLFMLSPFASISVGPNAWFMLG